MAALRLVESQESRDFTEDEARAHTDKIVRLLDDRADMIVEAWDRRAWAALGYESWADYCESEFDTGPFALRGVSRDNTILKLRAAGMSTRAVAAAVGVGKSTVDRISGVPDGTPAAITGTDGKQYTRPTPKLEPPAVDLPSAPGRDERVFMFEWDKHCNEAVGHLIALGSLSKPLPSGITKQQALSSFEVIQTYVNGILKGLTDE